MISMDPRRRELSRRHSQEMGALFRQFIDLHPDVEFYVGELTDEQDAAWDAFSAELLARHDAERAALADELKAERRS
jgi:hypothetical protein